METSTPAVVFRTFDYQGLGIMRSLGRLGVPVYGIDPDPWAVALRSRYCRGRFVWNVDRVSPAENVDLLLRTGRKIGRRSVLFNFSDELTVLIADYAEVLKEWFLFPSQPPDLVRALVSKKEMYFLAKREGIPTAETLFPTGREDVLRMGDALTFPVMLKGSFGATLQSRAGRTMAIARTANELLSLYDRMENPSDPDLMLQEYIPGGDDTVWMFNGYFDHDSERLVGWTGRKIRQAPVHVGATSLGVCEPNEVVEELTTYFMKRIGYRGILDIGYRHDARDGRYKVLDVNPRIGATFRLFVDDRGMDVARAAYLDLTGQTVPAAGRRPGRKWFVEDRDLVSSCRYARERTLTIGKWVRSFRGVEEAAYWSTDDVSPFLVRAWKCTGKLVTKGRFHLERLLGERPGAGRDTVGRTGSESAASADAAAFAGTAAVPAEEAVGATPAASADGPGRGSS